MFYRIFFIILLLSRVLHLAAQHQYGALPLLGAHEENLSNELSGGHSTTLDYVIIESIEFEGNNTTKQHILLREVVFERGDTLTREELNNLIEQSRENLLNTSLFNFVNASLLFHEMLPVANVRFTFVERWYVWPFPIFEVAERNLQDWALNPSFDRTNYGVYIVKENFRGRMERLRILARMGYKQNYSIGYTIPYINKAQNMGLGLVMGYNRRNEIEYMTRDNIQLFYTREGSFALNHIYLTTELFYRDGIYNRHNLTLEFNRFEFADSLLILNPLFSPGSETVAPFFSLGYSFKKDHRDVRAYPLKGYYYDIRLKRQGLGLLRTEKMDMTTAESSVRKFWRLHPRWFFSTGVNAKVSFGNFQPYYLQQGLGFKGDLVRGYENFVIDGQHFAVLKTNFKFALIPSRSNRIGFIRNEKFSLIHYALYVNFFADTGYVRDNIFFRQNPYSNNLLLGYGMGLDLVTYYDKVFRTEFSLTRQGDMGFHLHLIAPI